MLAKNEGQSLLLKGVCPSLYKPILIKALKQYSSRP